jgi:hypothetical protein
MPPPSNLERKAGKSRRKTQTKLTFDPVGTENTSSSPATKMSPARVRYQLPTPARSSQTLGTRTSSGRGMYLASFNYPRDKTLLTDIDVAGLRSTDNDDDLPACSPRASRDDLYNDTSDEGDLSVTPIHKKKAKKAPGAFRSLSDKPKQKQKQIQLSDNDSSEPDENNKDKGDNEDDDDENSEDELSLMTPKPKQRGRANARNNKSSSRKDLADFDEDDEEEEEEPVASGTRRRYKSMLVVSDDEDDDLPVLPKSKQSAVNIKRGGAHRESEIIELSSDDDDSAIVGPSPIKRRYSRTVIESESEQEAISSPLKRRKEVSESSDSDIVASPTKRSRPTLAISDEDEDSEIDAPRGRPRSRKPRSEAGTSPVTPSRVTRQARAPRKQHRTAKQKAAEMLRRKRAGEKIEKLTDSSSGGEDDGGALYDSDPEHHVLAHFSDEEPSPETLREQEPVQRASTQNEGGAEEDENAEDDEEEEEDEENPKWVINDGTDYRLGMFFFRQIYYYF